MYSEAPSCEDFHGDIPSSKHLAQKLFQTFPPRGLFSSDISQKAITNFLIVVLVIF